MTDIDRIIAGLSEAQRESIRNASDIHSNHGGYAFLTVRHTGELWPQGIAQFLTLKTDRLTELGIAVRNRLKEQDNA